MQRPRGWYLTGVEPLLDRVEARLGAMADGRASRILCRVLLAGLLVVIGIWVSERTTWYLAIDQFGYLTFARDLASGRVFHEWRPSAFLDSLLPPGLESDVLAQTYVRRNGQLYCRYAPGFPLLLAAAIPLGEAAIRSVNLVALLGLLVVLYGLARRLLGTEWHGLATSLLACLLPTYLLLWSISPLRDVPTHLFALGGLWASLDAWRRPGPQRIALAGFLLGYAASMRVDAILYLASAAGIAWLARPWPKRHLVAGLAGLTVGLLPVLAYNTVATGNPFVPTQFMEAKELVARANQPLPPWIAWIPAPNEASAAEPPSDPTIRTRLLQGGGLSLRHFSATLPENLSMLREVFGDLGLVLIGVGAVATFRSPILLVTTIPYLVTATLFFSLWTRADPRYLVGVVLMGLMLLVHGLSVVAASPVRRRILGGVTAIAVLTAGWILGGLPAPRGEGVQPIVTIALELALLAGLSVAVAFGRGRASVAAAAALAIVLSGVLAWRSAQTLGFRARFQQAEVERARETIAALVDEPAIILTRSDIGRPAENINYYTGADAIYEQELLRWGVSSTLFLRAAVRRGVAAYLLMPPNEIDRWIRNRGVRRWFVPELIAKIPASQAADVFVASPDHHGVPLQLVRVRLRGRVD